MSDEIQYGNRDKVSQKFQNLYAKKGPYKPPAFSLNATSEPFSKRNTKTKNQSRGDQGKKSKKETTKLSSSNFKPMKASKLLKKMKNRQQSESIIGGTSGSERSNSSQH